MCNIECSFGVGESFRHFREAPIGGRRYCIEHTIKRPPRSHDLAQQQQRIWSSSSWDYVTIEPAIEYVQDIRCLAVGERIWAMARRGRFWKANTETVSYEVIAVPPLLEDHTRRAVQHFGADLLGLDFLQTSDEQYVLLESNDTPGLTGFPDEVRKALAQRVRERIEG